MNSDDDLFFKKLEKHLRLKKRFSEILHIAENTSEELITADEAETKAEELQKLGQEVMQEWAECQHKKRIETFERENKTHRHTKKNSTGRQNSEK